MAVKTLLDIPLEVLSHHLFPQMEINDLLRLRRVCKPMKAAADDFIGLHGKSRAEIRVNFGAAMEEGKWNDSKRSMNVPLLLKMNPKLPTCKFSLEFQNVEQLLNNGHLQEFLEIYGGQIEELKVSSMSAPLVEEEVRFYESLVNLKCLTVGILDVSRPHPSLLDTKNEPQHPFPATFNQLTHLTVDICKLSTTLPQKTSQMYFWNLVESCGNLEYLCHPEMQWSWLYTPLGSSLDLVLTEMKTMYSPCSFLSLMSLILKPERVTGAAKQLRHYDLKNFVGFNMINSKTLPLFWMFCNVAENCGVKLLNMDSKFPGEAPLKPEQKATLENVIVSLRNLGWELSTMQLPLLEKLVIASSAYSMFDMTLALENSGTGMSWPNLRILDVTVDSTIMLCGAETHVLLEQLFNRRERPALQELTLKYKEFQTDPNYVEEMLGLLDHGRKADFPVPFTGNLVALCPNLTKLTLDGWPGEGSLISTLWKGLPLLEEVTLKECVKVEDANFIQVGSDGGVEEKPIFLQLNNLKKFKLLHMNQMPRITDEVFHRVFRHLKVKEFWISSSNINLPLTNITMNGIQSLLKGPFGETIEKFPFDNWTLAGVTPEEMDNLKKQFRSYFML